MRAERWWQEASVIDDLFTTPTAYEFIQATRLLRHRPHSTTTSIGRMILNFTVL